MTCCSPSGTLNLPVVSRPCTTAREWQFVYIDSLIIYIEFLFIYIDCLFVFPTRMKLFYPIVACVVNDNPEGQLMALVFNSALSNYGCTMCW